MVLTKKIKVVLIVLLVALLIISPLKIFGIFLIILMGAHLLRIKVDYFYKVVISTSIFFATNTLVAAILYVLKIPLPITFMLLIYLIFIGLLLFKSKNAKSEIVRNDKFNVILKILISLIVFGVFIFPILSRDDYTAFPIVTFGGDNISHIELIKEVEESEGYFYRPFEESKNEIVEGLSGYPQGLHINIYVLKEALKPIINLDSNYRFVFFFYAFSSAIYILFGWMFLLSTEAFIRTNLVRTLPGILATGALFTGLFFSLFALGSQSQVASMFLFLSMLAFLSYSMNSTKTSTKQIYLIISIVLLAGISFTWLLLLPIAGLILAVCALTDNLRSLLLKPRAYLRFSIASGFILLITLVQPLVQIMYSSPKMLGVNEIGYSITPSLYLISMIVLLAALLLQFANNNRKLMLTSLIIPSVFSIIILIYQFIQVGETRYYLYKVVFVLVMIATVIIASGVGDLLDEKVKSLPTNSSYLAILILLSVSALLVSYNVNNPNSLITKREGGAFSKELSVTALGLIAKNPERGKEIIAIGSCNREQDHTATRLVGALSSGNTTARQALLKGMLLPDKQSLLEAIKAYQADASSNLIIISSDYEIQTYLNNALSVISGEETFIDLDYGHVPKSSVACPNAVR